MTCWIRKRKHDSGRTTYQVLYRVGGRAYKQQTAGTFKTLKEAEARKTVIAGWLALGKNPTVELDALRAEPAKRQTMATAAAAFLASRHDVSAATVQSYRRALGLAAEFFTDPFAITVPDCREYVGWLADRFGAASVRAYWRPFAQLLDFLEIEPNPARNKTVRLPVIRQERPEVITRDQFHKVLAKTPAKYKLFLRVLEATAMRVSELEQLRWGDVDFDGRQFRIHDTKGGTGGRRWCPVPEDLLDEVGDLLPFEDRLGDARVFRQVGSRQRVAAVMNQACQSAGIAHFSPHSLRKRRASLWHAQLVPERIIQEWGGWKSAEVLREIYTLVILDATDDDWFGEARGRLDGLARRTRSDVQEGV